ncbi:MAG TPA: hypothetical protein ENN12_03195 [Epsilonproteobacteria bacterium]|nr:hypothetical protein [Campylobacterota bacterium]
MKFKNPLNNLFFKILFLLAGTMVAYGEYADTVNKELACPVNPIVSPVPSTSSSSETADPNTAFWVCPNLPNLPSDIKMFKVLGDIDFFSGAYLCDYHYEGGGYATSCSYKSEAYIKKIEEIKEMFIGSSGAGKGDGVIGKVQSGADVYMNDINPMNFALTSRDSVELPVIIENVNETIQELKRARDNASANAGELHKVEDYLNDLNTLSYKHLIEPYVKSPTSETVKKDANFALFLSGLVTLDPNIVAGYNENDGKMKISPEWRIKATSVSAEELGLIDRTIAFLGDKIKGAINWFKSSALGIDSETQEVEEGDQYLLNVSSWVDVFEMKLWGFYYHLNQRLDLGYDIISTQLLAIMMVWFMMAAGTKSGINYILNKEGVQQEVRPAIVKTITTLMAVSVFYVSLPTPKQSDYATTSPTDFPEEMQKNRTIMKWLIRYSAQEGSKIATMLSDLGLDAFLTFVVKKQQVFSGEQIMLAYTGNLLPLAYYFPASQITQECSKSYGMSDMDFFNTVDQSGAGVNVNNSYIVNSPFFENAGISKISYNSCVKSYKIIARTLSDVAYATEETKQRMENADQVMAQSIKFLVQNNIILQDKMGWINSFTIPVTYFMMKENDMFLTPSIDSEKVAKAAEKYNKSLNLASGSEVGVGVNEDDGIGTKLYKNLRSAYNQTTDTLAEKTAYLTSGVSQLMLWNILPGYGTIRAGIYDYLSRIYGDYFETQLHGNKKGNMGGFKSVLGGLKKKGMSLFGKLTPISRLVSSALDNLPTDVLSSTLIRTAILIISFVAAYYIWKTSFVIMFISLIAIMILLKIVYFFKDLLIHTFISVFIVVWAFASQQQGGQKITRFLTDTLVLMMYPSMIVLSTFIFIFVHELFSTLYTFIMKTMLHNQQMTVSLMGAARSDTDSFSAYFTIFMMDEFAQVLIYVFTVVLAYTIIIQLPEFILKKLGLQDSSATSVVQVTEKSINKADKATNPLAQ